MAGSFSVGSLIPGAGEIQVCERAWISSATPGILASSGTIWIPDEPMPTMAILLFVTE